jgi:hypothetical protein
MLMPILEAKQNGHDGNVNFNSFFIIQNTVEQGNSLFYI